MQNFDIDPALEILGLIRIQTVCQSIDNTEFVLKKLKHEESEDNTNAKIK